MFYIWDGGRGRTPARCQQKYIVQNAVGNRSFNCPNSTNAFNIVHLTLMDILNGFFSTIFVVDLGNFEIRSFMY